MSFKDLSADFLSQLTPKMLEEVELTFENVKVDTKTKQEVNHELAMPPEMRRKILADIGLKDPIAPELNEKYLPHLQVMKRLLEIAETSQEPLKTEKLVNHIWNEGRKARLYENEIQQLVNIFPKWLNKVTQQETLEIDPINLLSQTERDDLKEDKDLKGIIGESHSMQSLFASLEKISRSNLSVFIQGESGTGKELVAHAIHSLSERSSKAFIPVHCGALPETIIESELFGYEKGAFTGALTQKKGFFELANNGTIFLDEITETSLNIQVKLLRVLQEQQFFRLGGTTPVKVDCRVVVASNANVKTLIKEKLFRQDLYYRINEMTIVLPPLRERADDIPLLVDRFISKYAKLNNRCVPKITNKAKEKLKNYGWPGNIRELENVVKRAVVLCDETIDLEHFPKELKKEDVLEHHGENEVAEVTKEASETFSLLKELQVTNTKTLPQIVAELEKHIILQRLEKNNGNLDETAVELGVSKRTIQRKLAN